MVEIDAKACVFPSKMHKEVRSDPEVAAKLEELERAAKQYMGFDMQRLQSDVSRELENDINRLNSEYQKHKQSVNDRFRKCEELNKSSQQLKSDSVSMRTQKQRALHEISQQNKQFEGKYAQDNTRKADLR